MWVLDSADLPVDAIPKTIGNPVLATIRDGSGMGVLCEVDYAAGVRDAGLPVDILDDVSPIYSGKLIRIELTFPLSSVIAVFSDDDPGAFHVVTSSQWFAPGYFYVDGNTISLYTATGQLHPGLPNQEWLKGFLAGNDTIRIQAIASPILPIPTNNRYQIDISDWDVTISSLTIGGEALTAALDINNLRPGEWAVVNDVLNIEAIVPFNLSDAVQIQVEWSAAVSTVMDLTTFEFPGVLLLSQVEHNGKIYTPAITSLPAARQFVFNPVNHRATLWG